MGAVRLRSQWTLILLGVTLALSAVDGVDSALPVAWEVSRYSVLKQKCPFALANHPVATPAAQPSFAANWYVGGIAKVGDSDFVSIKSRDLSTQFTLYGRDPDPTNHVTLVRIEWVEGIGKSFVIVQKGAETAKLEFNEATVHGPAQTPPTLAVPGGKNPAGATLPSSGARPVPIGPANAGGPQRYLKTVPPPSNLASPAPNGPVAPTRPSVPGPSNAPRALPPGPLRRPASPGQVGR